MPSPRSTEPCYPVFMKRFAGLLGCFLLVAQPPTCFGCCAVSRAVDQVVNADQTVIILWDPETKRQHFIRQASFKSDTEEDIGFIVPSPSRPDLEEAGDEAFARLKFITAPVVRSGGGGFGCSMTTMPENGFAAYAVEVLERKHVAGFDAVVLKAETAEALVEWLAANDFAYSEAVADWARPYVEKGWPFTALKVAADDQSGSDRDAAALRISFQTETPLFPYREPDSTEASKQLAAAGRLLRIYFISDRAYEGSFDNGSSWSGRKAWSGDISLFRDELLTNLGLPETESGPKKWWLTEIEDQWPYAEAPGDIVFTPSKDQKSLQRTAQVAPHGLVPVAAIAFGVGMFLRRRVRRITSRESR
jgi:hypothetical protein